MARYVAAFDTPDDARRRQIVRVLKACGGRVQGSVFILQPEVGRGGLAWLQKRMKDILLPEDDFMIFAVDEPVFWWSELALPQWNAFEIV